MVKTTDILEGVKSVLRIAFPGLPEEALYTNLVPDGFLRPSFLVESGPREKRAGDYYTVLVDAQIIITAFMPVDKLHNTHVESLEDRTDEVESLFVSGTVQAGGRMLEVVKTEIDVGFDYGQVVLTLEYEDERPTAKDAHPLMGEVELVTRAE